MIFGVFFGVNVGKIGDFLKSVIIPIISGTGYKKFEMLRFLRRY
jgi:hypothetical protein